MLLRPSRTLGEGPDDATLVDSLPLLPHGSKVLAYPFLVTFHFSNSKHDTPPLHFDDDKSQ